ncbi:MAG: TolC family protein [Flavobacteriales bacterium]|nr:TolC family protein [Flavobacteriales bacterium]
MKINLTLAFLLAAFTVVGQSELTLEDAFKQALSNNYSIRIIESQKQIAENSATIGNAGLLPSVAASASAGINVNNTELEFAGNIPPTNVDNAVSTNTAAGINASYVLFNGLNGTRTYQKLKMNQEAVDIQSQAAIEGTLLQVASAYYVLARAIEQEEIATENLGVSIKRYEREQLSNELGTALKTELLAARVALTTDSSALLNAQLQRKTSLRLLSRLIANVLPEETTCSDATPELQTWSIDELVETSRANNSSIKNAMMQQDLAQKDYQLAWSSVMPSLTVNGGYNYNSQQSEAGIVLSNTSAGWSGSVGLNYPLFNGFRNKTARQNQKVNLEIRTLELENQGLQIESDIRDAHDTYVQSYRVAQFEEHNLEASELNLRRSEELYNSGQISSTQFREAQLGLTSAKIRKSNALISLRLYELEILRLTGQILSTE